MVKRIAIVPARGGSKRIPNKNIRDFCGNPMISYILNAAKQSALFDVIHVSTESLHIREVVESLGFTVDFMRPNELADDYTPIMPVLKYVVETYMSSGQFFDEVWLLMACAPLVECCDLKAAAEIIDNSEAGKSLLAIAEYPAPIEWAFTRTDESSLLPVYPGKFAIRSQDIEKKYFDAGIFAVFPIKRIINSEGAGSDDGFLGYVIPKNKAIDIDNECDWYIAEAMYKNKLV